MDDRHGTLLLLVLAFLLLALVAFDRLCRLNH